MKKITASILTTLLMLSMVFSSSVFAANEEVSAWDSFLGLFSGNATTTATDAVGVEYRGHIQNVGNFPLDGTWIQGPNQLGTVGQSLRLEGFWIQLSNQPENVNIQYRVHVQNEGWMTPVENGAFAGTEGKSQQIEAIEINLVDDEGNAVQGYSVQYKGHIQNQGDTAWFEDGQQLGTVGSFLRLEALEVKIVQTKADMTAYEAAVAEATALTEADYTAASWAALETALIDNLVTEDNTQAEVDAATAAINAAIDGLVKVAKISGVEAVGVKTLKVSFNQALTAEQQAATTLVVKKGSVTTNLASTTFATDGLSATILTSSKLTEGTYVVSTTIAGTASSASVTVEDETVSAIELTSDTAPQVSAVQNDQAVVRYKVTNQYGEVMTGQTITWSNSTGSVGTISDDKTNGILVIQNTSSAGVAFVPGAVVYITGVHTGSGTVLNDSVTIGVPAVSDKVIFNGVYSLDNKAIAALPAGFDAGDYVLLYEVMDQFGNKITSPTFGDLVFTGDNPLFIESTFNTTTAVTLNGKVYQAVSLLPGTNPDLGGTANINVISKFTGARSSYSITADSLSMLTKLTMTAPADMVSVGETVEIPFEAFDQNGVALTKYDDLAGKVTFTKPAAAASFDFVEQADGTATLEFDTTGLSDGIVTIATLVTGGSSFSALNIDVQEEATPTVIVGLDSGVSTAVALTQTFDVEATDFIIEDQYGRVMDDSLITNANTFIVYTATDMSGVVGTPTDLTFAGSSISVDDGTDQDVSSIEFALYTDALLPLPAGTLIAGSELAVPITVTTQSDYVSYEVADLGLMFNNADEDVATAAAFNKTVEVYGVKSNGTKVLLPTTEFAVSTDVGTKLVVSADEIADTAVVGNGFTAAEFLATDGVTAITIPVKVTVQVLDTAASGAIKATVVKDLTVSNAASTGTTITMNDTAFGGKYNIAAGATLVNALSGIAIEEVLDQYGVAMTPATTAVISNVTMATGSSFAVAAGSITGAVAGDTFTATFTYGTTEYSANFLVH